MKKRIVDKPNPGAHKSNSAGSKQPDRQHGVTKLGKCLSTSQQKPRNGKEGVGEIAGPLSIIEADKTAASLTNDQLAVKVRDIFADIRPQLEKWLPFAIELRSRFETMRRENNRGEILGCRTWQEFCEKKLRYSDRHIRRLMAGENPTSSKYSSTKHLEKPKKPAESGAKTALARADWTDKDYIRACVKFVQSTLQPLEHSDPPRFHRIAVAVAHEIADDFLADGEPASDSE